MNQMLSFFFAPSILSAGTGVSPWIVVLIGIIALGAGIAGGYFLYKLYLKKTVGTAEQQAETILRNAKHEAKTLKKEAIQEAREENQKLKHEQERQFRERNSELQKQENRLNQKRASV